MAAASCEREIVWVLGCDCDLAPAILGTYRQDGSKGWSAAKSGDKQNLAYDRPMIGRRAQRSATIKGNSSHESALGNSIQQHVTEMATAEPGDDSLFIALVGYSLQLAAEGQFDHALWVADEAIALAAGRSVLPSNGRARRRGGLGAKMTEVAKLAKEEILAVREDASK
jgi:hypothetical protein